MDDERHVGNIESAGGNIRGDEDSDASRTELFEDLGALSVRLRALVGAGMNAPCLEIRGEAVNAVPRGQEDERAPLAARDGVEDGVAVVGGGDLEDVVVDGGCSGYLHRRVVAAVLGEEVADDVHDLTVEGGGEEDPLGIGRSSVKDPANLAEEAMVDEQVGLIEDSDLDALKVHDAVALKVEGASGCGNEEVYRGGAGASMPGDRHAADSA